MLRIIIISVSIIFITACTTFFNKKISYKNKNAERLLASSPPVSLEPASLESQLKLMDTKKPTVCTITINSSDEKEIFQSFLKKDFNFIELATGDENWFEKSCEKKIKCDVLVVSGHFGGSFFGASKYRLPLTTLQRKSCNTDCDGILRHPKEVFLFGCNTTAGKKPDHRTPEEYTQVLIEDGLPQRQAAQISAFRYSPIGQKTKDKMRQIFPYSRIYGYHSQAPLGQDIRSRLNKYFKSIPKSNYKNHLSQFPTDKENILWSKAMKGQWIRSVNGSKDIENPSCILESKKTSLAEKLTWVNSIFEDREKSLAYVPLVNDYIKSLEKKYGSSWDKFPKQELSFIENIQFNKEAKNNIISILDKPIFGIFFAQIQVLNFTQRVGWLTKKQHSIKLQYFMNELFKENLDLHKKDMFCSLNIKIDLTLKILPKTKWNKYTILAIVCSKTTSLPVHLALAETLKDKEETVRAITAWALQQLKPTDLNIHLAVAEALKDKEETVRFYAVRALEQFNSTDLKIQFALAEALKDPESGVSRVAATALTLVATESTDLKIQFALAEALTNAESGVRKQVVLALKAIKPTNLKIQLALAKALKDPEREVREVAAWALKGIRPTNLKIQFALAEALKDPESGVRKSVAWSIGRIKPIDLKVLFALTQALKDPEKEVREQVAWSLAKINPTNSQVLKKISSILKDKKLSFKPDTLKMLKSLTKPRFNFWW